MERSTHCWQIKNIIKKKKSRFRINLLIWWHCKTEPFSEVCEVAVGQFLFAVFVTDGIVNSLESIVSIPWSKALGVSLELCCSCSPLPVHAVPCLSCFSLHTQDLQASRRASCKVRWKPCAGLVPVQGRNIWPPLFIGQTAINKKWFWWEVLLPWTPFSPLFPDSVAAKECILLRYTQHA